MRRHAVGVPVPDIAGVVEAVGVDVVGFVSGDRVAFRATLGAVDDEETVTLPADSLIGVPRGVTLEQAASLLTPGIVARTMLKQLQPVRHGDAVRVDLRDGTLRRMLGSWATALGARIVEDDAPADVVYDANSYRAAMSARYSQGQLQQAAADVFVAVRDGVFGDLALAA